MRIGDEEGKTRPHPAPLPCPMKPGYEIRYRYNTAPIRRYGKISKIKIRYGWDTLIKKII